MTTTDELMQALSTAGWPTRLVTLADWDALPEDESCQVEVSEGVLQIVPNPHPRHQLATVGVIVALRSSLPPDTRTLMECDVLLKEDPLTVRGPDVLVVGADALARGDQRFRAADLLLAVEVISPGSRRTDRVTKASEYAEAGIPQYWILDVDGPVKLTCLALDDAGTYAVASEHTGEVTLEVAGAPVVVDLDALVR